MAHGRLHWVANSDGQGLAALPKHLYRASQLSQYRTLNSLLSRWFRRCDVDRRLSEDRLEYLEGHKRRRQHEAVIKYIEFIS